MKKYEAYKNSGVEWIGEIPEGWESLCFKHFVTQITTPSTHPNKIALENIESKTGNFVSTDSEFEGNGIAFEVDDIVYGKLRPYLQKVWKAEFEGNAVGDFFVFRVKDNCIASYLKYIMLSDNFTSAANGSTYGAKMPRVASEFIANSVWFLPSLSEQQAIASYLDHKVGQIDASVSAINTQIDDLKVYRQSIISEAVTKGLNPNVPMKNSGIQWIGEIPDNWECVKVKHILHQSKDGIKIGPFGSSLTGKVDTKGDFKVYGQWNIVGKDFTAGRNYVGKDTYESLNSYVIVAGDILVSMMGTVGKCAIIPKGLLPGIMDSHVVKVRLDTSKMIPSYFEYVYDKDNSNVIFSQIQKYRRGSIMDGLNSTLIKEFTLPSPPLSEQQAIASYLDSKTSKIDAAIASLESQRDDLNALKQSVISEAVTGKIDVREWKKD